MAKNKNSQSIVIKKSKGVEIGDLNLHVNGGPQDTSPVDETGRETAHDEAIRQLIAHNRTQDALELLLKTYRDNPRIYEAGILLLNRLNRVETENRLGVLDTAGKDIELNRINKAVLESLGG